MWSAWRDAARSPASICWGLLLLLLVVQWLNSGRELAFVGDAQPWGYASPRWRMLPSAINREAAGRFLAMFILAATTTTSLRMCYGKRQRPISGSTLIAPLVIPAGVLGWTVTAQWMLAQMDGPFREPAQSYFLMGFGYANHAGSYFVLALSGCLALVYRSVSMLVTPGGPRRERTAAAQEQRRLLLWGLLSLGCLLGVHLSLSRYAIIAAWALCTITCGWIARNYWRDATIKQRTNLVLGLLIALMVGLVAIQVLVGGSWRQEFDSLARTGNTGLINHFIDAALLGTRPILRETAIDVWLEHPLFGTGADAFRYLAPLALNPGYLAQLGEGSANVHCDPLEFLCEMGLVGSALLAALVVLPFAGYRRHGASSSTARIATAGVVAIALHACMDLPLRHPAVLSLWLCFGAIIDLTRPDQPRRNNIVDVPSERIPPGNRETTA